MMMLLMLLLMMLLLMSFNNEDDDDMYAEANFSVAPICSLISPPLLAADARCSTEAPL